MMIEIKNISKDFNKGKVHAVRNVSFTLNKNEIFGLLGPNGAGKTTTMRMLSTLINPTSGTIAYDGKQIKGNELPIRKNLGFLTTEIKLDEEFTPNELADYYGKLYGLSKEELECNKKYLFDYFGINEFSNKRYGTFSTGMKQKTSIAICMIHNPEVVIFDEPTNGLDILTQKLVEDYILELKKQGKCIIISTHILDVIERLADRIGVIIDGVSIYEGSKQGFVEEMKMDTLRSAFIEAYRINHHDGETK